MEQTKKRAAAPPGMMSLLPLLCAALLLLSGCRPRSPLEVPVPHTDDGETEELPDHALTRDLLPSALRKDLDDLYSGVRYVSGELAELESKNSADLKDVLSSAETCLQYLTVLTNQSQDEFDKRYGADVDTVAPGLRKFSDRLATMLMVTQSNLSENPMTSLAVFSDAQEALEKLWLWLDELDERARVLPDLPLAERPPEPEPEPEASAGENPDAVEVSTALGALSDRIAKLSATVNDISQTLNGTPFRISLGVFVFVCFVLLVLIFALLILLFGSNRALARQMDIVKMTKATGKMPDKEMDKVVDKIVDKVAERVNERFEREAEKMSNTVLSVLREPEPPAPKSEPERCYFIVTSQTVAEGKPISLKKQATRGEILGISRDDRPGNAHELYDIYPVMVGTMDNGKRGVLHKDVLTSGDIKQCFDIPKQLPPGDRFFVTVAKPAIAQQTGNNQYLLEWKYRGALSVIGTS